MSIRRQTGVTLVELVLFIIVISVGVVGVMSVMGNMVTRSADPMARKQALAIAESLLTEVQQQAFTFCDPQDANVLTATSGAGCASAANDQSVLAPTSGESRGDATDPFDNVADYAGYSAAGNVITGNASLSDYTASVTITEAGGAGAFSAQPAGAVLQIVVRVTGRNEDVSLTGYRVRYAPNSPG